MLGTSSFEARLAEADAYLKLLIDHAKVCMHDKQFSSLLFCLLYKVV